MTSVLPASTGGKVVSKNNWKTSGREGFLPDKRVLVLTVFQEKGTGSAKVRGLVGHSSSGELK